MVLLNLAVVRKWNRTNFEKRACPSLLTPYLAESTGGQAQKVPANF